MREVDESGNVVRLTDLETLPQYDLDEDARSNRVIAEVRRDSIAGDCHFTQVCETILFRYFR